MPVTRLKHINWNGEPSFVRSTLPSSSCYNIVVFYPVFHLKRRSCSWLPALRREDYISGTELNWTSLNSEPSLCSINRNRRRHERRSLIRSFVRSAAIIRGEWKINTRLWKYSFRSSSLRFKSRAELSWVACGTFYDEGLIQWVLHFFSSCISFLLLGWLEKVGQQKK